jgi:hypothetical protein
MKLLALAILLPCLAANNATDGSNYYEVSTPAYSVANGNIRQGNGTAPAVDIEVLELLQGEIPEDALLEIMDKNNADYGKTAGHPPDYSGPASARWYPRANSTFNSKLFIHKTRCYAGKDGVAVHASTVSPAQGLYKKCTGTMTDFSSVKQFPQPPYLCQETCDKDPSCATYVVGGAGEVCWILSLIPASHDSYYYIGAKES